MPADPRTSPPTARAVDADAVAEPGTGRAWARGLLWVLGAAALTAVVRWATGVDVLLGAVVATTALGILGDGAVTGRRALRCLGLAAALALTGAVTLGRAGIGPGAGERLAQGAGGVAAAALVLLVAASAGRRRPAADRSRPSAPPPSPSGPVSAPGRRGSRPA